MNIRKNALLPENDINGDLKMKTNHENQIAFRARKKQQGLKEIRNLWVKPEDMSRVKKYVAKLNKGI